MSSTSIVPEQEAGIRILIVSDDRSVRETLEGFVRTSDYPSTCRACVSAEAESTAESCRPGLLIMDLSPSQTTDGIDLAERVSRKRPVPLVFVIGELNSPTLARAVGSDPLGFISKPLKPTNIQATLALGMKRLEQARKASRSAERIRAGMETLLRAGMSGLPGGPLPDSGGSGDPNGSAPAGSEESSKIKHLETILDRIAMTLTAVDDASPSTAGASLPWTRLPRLTAREREVLRWLASGQRVATIATKLNVAPSTVRNHLKSIFRKLEVRSQTELLELVSDLK